MSLSSEKKQAIIKKFGKNHADSASTEVQIALLTERLNDLRGHFETNKKDNHSRLGLLRMVGRRKRLLTYLNRTNHESYKSLIAELGIRK